MTEQHFCFDPNSQDTSKTITLTENRDSWIVVDRIPQLLSHYASVRFNQLFAKRPNERGSVCMAGKTVESPRWHQSFMNTPVLDSRFDKQSYMFAGTKKQRTNAPLPIEFRPFLDYVNATMCRDK